ncbi:MAG: VTT domain-containing protein [Angelakisella sp.]
MTIEIIQNYIIENGVWMLVLFVAMEYLGLPGYPGGIILPAIGIMSRMGLVPLHTGVIIALIVGSITMVGVYLVGLKFSQWSVTKLSQNQKFAKSYARMQELIRKYGAPSIFVVRLIPVVRTFGSIIAGILGMEWRCYCIYSFLGNLVYTLCAIGLGYFATGVFV